SPLPEHAHVGHRHACRDHDGPDVHHACPTRHHPAAAPAALHRQPRPSAPPSAPSTRAYSPYSVTGTSRESASAAARWRTLAWYYGMDSRVREAAADG